MNSYVVIDQSARLGPGTVLTLTKEQVAPRRHNLEVIEEDGEQAIVRTLKHIEFKAGETIQIDGVPPKSVSAVVVTPEVAEALAAEEEAEEKPKRARRSRKKA